MRATLILLTCCACYAAPEEIDAPTPVPQQPEPQRQKPEPVQAPPVTCDMSKFSFTQDIGCMNDGWVEFCAEKGGAPTTTALRAISSELSIQEGLIGRAGCNEATEYFVSQPVHAADCTGPHGALLDTAWGVLCALSQLPETKHFVPGFAE